MKCFCRDFNNYRLQEDPAKKLNISMSYKLEIQKKNTMEFQTRNNDGKLKFFGTFAEAFAEAKRDKSVWKISFDLNGNSNRWVLKPTSEQWSRKSETKLRSLSEKYATEAKDGKNLYWVHQEILAPDRERILRQFAGGEDRIEEELALNCIIDICTNEEFFGRFGKM